MRARNLLGVRDCRDGVKAQLDARVPPESAVKEDPPEHGQPDPHGGLRELCSPSMLGCYVHHIRPCSQLREGKLTFDERVVVHRAGRRVGAARALQTRGEVEFESIRKMLV